MTPIPISQFADELLNIYGSGKHARKTKLAMRHCLELLAGLPDVKTTADLRTRTMAQLVERAGELSPNTVIGQLGYLRAACSYAIEEGYLDRAPSWKRVRPRERAATLNPCVSYAEAARLVDLLKSRATSWEGRRLYALVCTILLTGIRRDEALYSRVEDLDLGAGTLKIEERSRRLKTLESARYVPLPDALVFVLKEWLPHIESPWLFPGVKRKGPWTGGMPGRKPIDSLKRAAADVGIQRITWHGLRHTFGTHALTLFEVPLWALQLILGHTDLRTTQRYLHLSKTSTRLESVQKIAYRKPN
jgi:integrase